MKRNTNLVSDNIQIEVRYSYLGEKNRIEYEDNHFKKNYFIGFVENEPESSALCYFEIVYFMLIMLTRITNQFDDILAGDDFTRCYIRFEFLKH